MGSRAFYLCLIVILINIIIIFYKRRYLGSSLKIIGCLLFFTLCSEIIALVVKNRYATKAPVYHFFSILELFLIMMYFYFSIYDTRKIIVMVLCAIFCLALGIGNLFYFQSLMDYNTNMLMLECVLIIGMALFAMFKILLRDDIINILSYPHFQIWAALLFLWSSTFFFWAFLDYLKNNNPIYYEMIAKSQVFVNLLFYTYLGFVFAKLKTKIE